MKSQCIRGREVFQLDEPRKWENWFTAHTEWLNDDKQAIGRPLSIRDAHLQAALGVLRVPQGIQVFPWLAAEVSGVQPADGRHGAGFQGASEEQRRAVAEG
jgi:hypothetical protein